MEFFKVKTIQLSQLTTRPLLSCVIAFKDLIRMVSFTARIPDDITFNFENVPEPKTTYSEPDYYQRLINDNRTKDISAYLLQGIYNLKQGKDNLKAFPTSIIIAVPDIRNYLDDEIQINNQNFESIIESTETAAAYFDPKGSDIYLPYFKCALIVDGQHRIAGLRALYERARNKSIIINRKPMKEVYPGLKYSDIMDEIEKISFPCTLLLGFNLWEQGQIFADVNFNQKPVNRSLYYDIFGSYPDLEKNDLFIIHQLALHLNNNPGSPLKNRIKMLGSGEGIFSQASFVEAVRPFFTPRGIWHYLLPGIIAGRMEYKFVADVFRMFFASVKNNFSENWPSDDQRTSYSYKSIMLKTTGLNALINLMGLIYRDASSKGFNFEKMSSDKIKTLFDIYLKRISENQNKYFGPNGNYAGAGSRGLQSQLYNEMKDQIDLIKVSRDKISDVIAN